MADEPVHVGVILGRANPKIILGVAGPGERKPPPEPEPDGEQEEEE